MRRLAAIGLPRENWRVVADCTLAPHLGDYVSEYEGDNVRHRRSKSGLFRIEHSHDRRGDLLPLAVLAGKLAASFFREGVKTRFAIVLGSAPLGTDELSLLEALQRRIQRAMFDD